MTPTIGRSSPPRQRFLVLVWLGVLLFTTAGSLVAQSHAIPAKSVRILFIGNSYTYFNDLPKTLQSMALVAKTPVRIEIGSRLIGGASLSTHWNDDTIELIQRGAWDYVVLQEQSLGPLQASDDFIAYGTRFGEEIRAAKAQPILYLTWARRGRPSAQDSLDRAYRRLGAEIGATIVPVGPAWLQIQQLDSSADLYAADGSHPSPLGSFVAATTLYRTLFGELPPRSYTAGSTVSPHVVTLVQRAVETTVTRFTTR